MVTITTRSGKGSPLTNDEVDANFNNLNTKVSGIEASADVTDTANVVAALTAGTNVAIASDGTISSTDTNTTYSVGDGQLSQNNFTNADHSKLDGIEASADVTDTANVTAAGALMDSELTSIANVKALNQSVISGATPTFGIDNMTIDDTDLVVADTTSLQTFAEGVDQALLKARGTGVTSTYVSTVAVGGTTFAQPAVQGEISSDQGYFDISYAGATGITVATLTATSTYVYIDKDGNLQQQTSAPTRQDFSRKVFTMRIGVNTAAQTILGFEYLNNPIGHYANSIRDLYTYLLAQGIPLKKGQTVTGRSGDLGFDVGSGSLMEFGGTGDIHNANIKSFNAVANASYTLLSRTGVVSTQTDLQKYWDNNGTITALGSTTLVGHRLYRYSDGAFAIQYGQGNYGNMALAKAGVVLESYVLNPLLEDATFCGWWFIQSTATATTGDATLADFSEYTIGIQGGSSGGLAGCLLKGNNLSDLLSVSAAQVNLDLEPGVDVQAYSSILANTTASFTSADNTKLDAIEASADVTDTANVVAALTAGTNVAIASNGTISSTDTNTTYSVGDGGLSQNNFTNADHTKLNAIEASADVTDATNVTAAGALMDSEITNLAEVKAFAASDYAVAAQGTKADAALPKTGGAMTGAITTNSTFDGRDVATDGTKLDGIEASADVTDTANVVAALTAGTNVAIAANGTISATDTNTTYSVGDGGLSQNNFTNADHTKLNGIETSATADQTAAQILTAVKTVDGASSGLDADLLDGQQGSYYTGYTDTAVANIVDSSPEALNTLNELAAALGDDANFATTTATSLGEKLPKSGGAMTGAITTNSTFDGRDVATDGTKLDGIEVSADVTDTANVVAALTAGTNVAIASNGTISSTDTNTTYSVGDGGLSQNNFTNADHTKLNAIEASADVTDTTNVVAALTAGTNVAIAANGTISSTDTNTTYSVGDGGLSQINFTSADHTKLNGIAASANNYTHPSHPGDDFSIDTGALSGATVISDLDINITTDTSGHVTDANATVSTRNITLANLGYTGATNANNSTSNATHSGEVTGSAALTIASNVVDADNLKVTGNGSTTQFLRSDGDGTFTWAVPTDTNTTYSVGDGGLSQINFTSADHTKLNGIEASADVTDTTNVVAALTAGTNVAIAANGTISSTDTNTTYSSGDFSHDSLSGFVANEHINHTSVTLTAGAGMTGGGTIAASRTFNVAGVTSSMFSSASTVLIKNAAGTTLKTIRSPGS